MSDFNEHEKMLEKLLAHCQAEVAKAPELLFNAFTLTYPELFLKEPPYSKDYLEKIEDTYYTYVAMLQAMGQHKLDKVIGGDSR